MRDLFELETITITLEVDGESREVQCSVQDYVDAKTKDLIAFGYSDLKTEDVLKSVWRIVSGEKKKDVIDHFISDDIKLDDD